MNIEEIRDYCIGKKGVTESFPFDDKVLVFKVANKMFALVNVEECTSVNLKCDPTKAVELRASYVEIEPGYHMSKKHWNTVSFIGTLSNTFVFELIDHSYELVVSKLTKKEKAILNELS